MGKITSIIILSLLFFSCNNGEAGTKNPETKVPVIVNTEKSGEASKSGESDKAINLTKADFLEKVMNYEANPTEWKYEGDLPCVIDFYADWCGPCKIASPVLEELAAEYAGKIYVYKVNTEVERELSSVFGIRSIPAFLFVPQEGKPTMSSGIARTPEETKEMFRKMIDEVLLGESVAQTL